MSDLVAVVIEVLRKIWWAIYLAMPVKFIIVEVGYHGVRFTLGKPGPNLEPGIRFASSAQTLTKTHTRLCENAVDEINLTLKDGTPIRVDGVVTYKIDDLGAFLTASEDTDWLLSEFAEAGLQITLSELTFKEFHSDSRGLEKRIRRELQAQCRKARFGVTIQYFRVKKFKVICPTAQTALAVDVLVDAIKRIPNALAERAGFGAKVALVAGAVASNVVAGADDEEMSARERDDTSWTEATGEWPVANGRHAEAR